MRKKINMILAVLVSVVIVILVVLFVVYFLIWPMPDIFTLLPGTPLAYVRVLDLGDVISSTFGSDFVSKVAESPIWKDLRSSELWHRLSLQKSAWEQQIGMNQGKLIARIGKNALLALYGGLVPKPNVHFLLIGEVDPIARKSILLKSTEETLMSMYEFAKESYRGIKLMTAKDPTISFSYGFIGRAGLLSSDISLLKKAIDVYKGDGQGLANTPEFNQLIADLPDSRFSFYISRSLLKSLSPSPKTTLESFWAEIIQRIDAWVGTISSENGNIRFSHSILYKGGGGSKPEGISIPMNGELPVPSNCLVFAFHKTLGIDSLFSFLGPKLSIIGSRFLPLLHNGIAGAILIPNIEKSQLLPPLIFFLRVRDYRKAETALDNIKELLKKEYAQLEFARVIHEGTPINYARLLLGMGLPIDIGYAFIGDNMLVSATDMSALRSVIDVSLGKSQSLMNDENYINVLGSARDTSDAFFFMDLGSIATIMEQSAGLYAWQARIVGDRNAERIATILGENAFVLSAWRSCGATFDFDRDRLNVRLILNANKP